MLSNVPVEVFCVIVAHMPQSCVVQSVTGRLSLGPFFIACKRHITIASDALFWEMVCRTRQPLLANETFSHASYYRLFCALEWLRVPANAKVSKVVDASVEKMDNSDTRMVNPFRSADGSAWAFYYTLPLEQKTTSIVMNVLNGKTFGNTHVAVGLTTSSDLEMNFCDIQRTSVYFIVQNSDVFFPGGSSKFPFLRQIKSILQVKTDFEKKEISLWTDELGLVYAAPLVDLDLTQARLFIGINGQTSLTVGQK